MKNIVTLSTFLLCFILTLFVSWQAMGIGKKVFVQDSKQVPFLQVVVLTKDGPQYIRGELKDIEEVLATQQEATLLIPVSQQEAIQSDLNKNSEDSDSFISIQVEQLAAERQMIEVFLYGDPSNYAFGYEATRKNLIPKYYMRLGVFDLLRVSAVSLIVAIIIHELVRRFFKARAKKRLAT